MWVQIILDILTISIVLAGFQKYRVMNIRGGGKKIYFICAFLILAVAGFYFGVVQKGYGVITILNIFLIFTLLLLAAGVDYKFQKIPNLLVGIGFIGKSTLLVAEIGQNMGAAFEILAISLIGCMGSLLLMLLLSALTRHGIGYGDVKLFAMIGYAFGLWDTYSILFYSALFAALYGGYLLAIKKAGKEHKMPFAPFVFAGMYLVCILAAI